MLVALLGYAVFNSKGHFVRAYRRKYEALAKAEKPYLICMVGWDVKEQHLFINIPHSCTTKLYLDQFWCMTHDYWMDKLERNL